MINRAISLSYALAHIGHVFNIAGAYQMNQYRDHDPHGGYHAAYNDGFPIGSMWRVEGQFLYALICT